MASKKNIDHNSPKGKPPGVHRVGRSLYLKVTESTTEQPSRSWVFRYRDRGAGKQRWMGLGPFGDKPPGRTLTEVREYKPKASDPPGFAPWTAGRCRDVLAASFDPIAERDKERVSEHKRRASSITFDEAAKLCHAARASEFRSLATVHAKGNVTPINAAAA